MDDDLAIDYVSMFESLLDEAEESQGSPENSVLCQKQFINPRPETATTGYTSKW